MQCRGTPIQSTHTCSSKSTNDLTKPIEDGRGLVQMLVVSETTCIGWFSGYKLADFEKGGVCWGDSKSVDMRQRTIKELQPKCEGT
jgi:hypothetical protein